MSNAVNLYPFTKITRVILENGYNINMVIPKGFHHSEETLKKMSESKIGEKNPMYGKHFSEEHRKKLSENHRRYQSDITKQKISEVNKNKEGHPHTEDAKKRIGDANRGRSSPLKGTHIPEERKKRISEKRLGKPHPHKGYIISNEAKIKMSLAKKGKPLSEEHRKKLKDIVNAHHPMKGKHHSKETRRKIGNANRGHKCSEEMKKKLSLLFKGRYVSEETRERLRIARLKRKDLFPQKDTTIELILQKGLDDLGIKYEKHKTICDVCQPDILFPELKIAVFADGEYWHSKEIKNGKIWEKDRKQDRVLPEMGWKVLRFWEDEIRKNPEKCINKIIEVINNN